MVCDASHPLVTGLVFYILNTFMKELRDPRAPKSLYSVRTNPGVKPYRVLPGTLCDTPMNVAVKVKSILYRCTGEIDMYEVSWEILYVMLH